MMSINPSIPSKTSGQIPSVGKVEIDLAMALQSLEFPFKSLVFARHLHSQLNAARDCLRGNPSKDFAVKETAHEFLETCSDKDGGLSSEGISQGRRLTQELSSRFMEGSLAPPDVLIVSPFLRTQETCIYIGAACPAAPTIILEPRIREREIIQTILSEEDLLKVSDSAESSFSLDKRTFEFFNDLCSNEAMESKNIWLITHGYFSKRFLSQISQGRLSNPLFTSFPNGALLSLTPGPGKILGDAEVTSALNLVSPGTGGPFWGQLALKEEPVL